MGEVTCKGLNTILFGFYVYCVQILGLKRSFEWLPTVAPRRQQQYSRSRIRLKFSQNLSSGNIWTLHLETVHLSNFAVKRKYDYLSDIHSKKICVAGDVSRTTCLSFMFQYVFVLNKKFFDFIY